MTSGTGEGDIDDRSVTGGVDPHDGRRTAERAAIGDHASWERIYRAAYPRLRAYAARHVGPDAADDVVSETMVRAVAGISGFRWSSKGIEPWLYGIARRVVADHHRVAGRRARWARAVAAPAPAQPADVVELAEEHSIVLAAFGRLSAPDRELLELRVIAGLSPEQTAVALGKRPGAVRTAQHRALVRLRRGLEAR